MADSLGVEPHEVREMESRLTGHDMAFDPAADADDDSAYQSPAHYLEDHRYDPARQLEDADWVTVPPPACTPRSRGWTSVAATSCSSAG